MFKPVVTAILDLICVGYLTFFRFFKLTYREMSTKQRIRNYIMLFCFVVCLAALLQALFGENIVTLTFIVRPIVIIVFFSQVRARIVDILVLTKQLLITLVAIFCFVLLSSFCGYIIFKSTFEGSSTCPTPAACYYQMMILLTTANFPDVMLPGYDVSYLSSLFFIVYFVFAFYFLLNILLASVFNLFMQRLKWKADMKLVDRIKGIEKIMD